MLSRQTLPWMLLAPLVLAAAPALPAGASGYWNMPSTFCQCFGGGYGAGYHAPLVLGPISFEEWGRHGEVRLPYSPRPANCFGGCYGPESAGGFGEASLLAPDPRLMPEPAPTSAPLHYPGPSAYRGPYRR